MLLDGFDPSDTETTLLVNRGTEQGWLRQRLERYLRLAEDASFTGRSLCIIGDKGSGKTILTSSVIAELRRSELAGRALFLSADCRRLRGRREVFGAVAQAAVRELYQLHSLSAADVRYSALLANARALSALSQFDDVELKTIHEHLFQFKAALNLKGPRSLLGLLEMDLGVSLERSLKDVKELTGKVRIDEHRLCGLFCAFFKDVRAQGLHVVLHLDNIDELRHEYQEDRVRAEVRKDVDGILALREAPIALVLNMRTYYSGALPREISNRLVLKPLTQAALREMAEKRMDKHLRGLSEAEQAEGRSFLTNEKTRAAQERLGQMAATPLSYLTWFKFLAEAESLQTDGLSTGLGQFLETYYSTVPQETLRKLAAAFTSLGLPIGRDKLLLACDGNEALLTQLLSRQAVLPGDFWHPTDYTLDPELHFLFWEQQTAAS